MTESEFNKILEESGFSFSSHLRGKEYLINGKFYRITMSVLESQLQTGVHVLRFGEYWQTENSFTLVPNVNRIDKFYRDCIKCFSLIDLIFIKMEELKILKFQRFRYVDEHFVLSSFDLSVKRFVLSFNESDFMFDSSIGFALYEVEDHMLL
jgi:hypothetical protein